MYLYFAYFILIVIGFSIYERVGNACRKFKLLDSSLKKEGIDIVSIVKGFVYSYLSYVLTSFSQKFNLNVVKVTPYDYTIYYAIDGNTYSFNVKKKRGPNNILMVTNQKYLEISESETKQENEKIETKDDNCTVDVTDKILEKMGPSYNFYNIQTKVRDLGLKYDYLTFYMATGEEKLFNKEDVIDL